MMVINEHNISKILRIVTEMTPDGNAQLSILALSLICACHQCNVPKGHAMSVIEGMFNEHEIMREEQAQQNATGHYHRTVN